MNSLFHSEFKLYTLGHSAPVVNHIGQYMYKAAAFLALLDYVSRAHEIEIRPSSVVRPSPVVRRPSSVRLWHRLSLKLLHGFLSNFGCGFPWAICPDVFWFFYAYFSFSLTWDPMGAKISKRYSSYKLQPKVFKLFLNFLPNHPHKTILGIFGNFKLPIFKDFFSKISNSLM